MLATLLDALSPHVVVLDRFGRIEHANRSWFEFGKTNRARIDCIEIGADYLSICRQAAQQGDSLARSAVDAIEGALERRVPSKGLKYPCHEPGPKGKERWFMLKVDPMPVEHGGVVITHTEITDVKLLADRLSETGEWFRLAIEAAGMGVWSLALDSNVLTWSEQQFRLMGLAPFSIAPTLDTWAARIHPDDLARAKAALDAAIESQQTYRTDYRVIWPDGSVHWLSGWGRPIYDEQSRCIRVLGLVIDNTEREFVAEKLRANMAQLQRLQKQLEADNEYLRAEILETHQFGSIVGTSAPMRDLFRQIEQIASTEVTVLILGETGTGKELLARAIHNLSNHRDRPLVKVDCASLPAALIESELFGHERGAFTGAVARRVGRFELADDTTVFLDEIGELPLQVQGKLLRVLQEQEFERLGSSKVVKINARIIAATHRDLSQAIRQGEFREDLFYRLNVYPIHVPPLRERKEDIGPLAKIFLENFEKHLGRSFHGIPQTVLSALEHYHWPGNVRELRNVIERAAVTSATSNLTLPAGWAMTKARQGAPQKIETAASDVPQPPRGDHNNDKLESVERAQIFKVLERTGWRIEGERGAAKSLGVKPSTLRSRMSKLGLRRSTAGIGKSDMTESYRG